MDLIPIENIKYIESVCENENHIKRKNERSLQLYFINPSTQQANKSIHIICHKCTKRQDLACCKVGEFKNKLNEILKKYHWSQILLNTKFETNISKAILEIIYKEEFLINGQPITALEIATQQSELLYHIHQALDHQNRFQIIELFQQSFQILKEKVGKCFFDIFDEPQVKIEFKDQYQFFILLKEQNIIIGHNQYEKKSIIYNYKNQRQIQFNVVDAKLCYNQNFVIYQYQYKDYFLKIVELDSLQQKVLMKVESQIKEMEIIKQQLWIEYNDQEGKFIWNLNFQSFDSKDFKRVLLNKISLFYSRITIENQYFYYPCGYLREIVDIRNDKVILRLRHRISYILDYDQQKKIIVLRVDCTGGHKIFIYNFVCKKLIRGFRIKNYWCSIYHSKYLAYFVETMLTFIDIFNAQQIFRLNIQENQIRLNKQNYFHLRIQNQDYFWFNK